MLTKNEIKQLILAAEQGHVHAQYMLGVMYKHGKSVPHNDKTAIKWYTRAAEQGHTESQYYVKRIAKDFESLPSQKSSEKSSEKTIH